MDRISKINTVDASQIDINISNVNASSQIVLNDLRLLELLNLYPFLFCKSVSPFQDSDYDEWAWEQITKTFNMGYSGLQLSAPFTSEELQWRWDILRPILGTLAKSSSEQQMHKPLWAIIDKISRMMEKNQSTHQKRLSSLQEYILSQMDLFTNLSVAEQRSLEVEVLDALFHEELQQRAMIKMGHRGNEIVQQEYEEFLKQIRVRELPKSADFLDTSDPTASIESSPESSPNIFNNSDTSMVISSVYSADEPDLLNSDSELSPDGEETESAPTTERQVQIKTEPPELSERQCHAPPRNDDLAMRYVPLKSVKYYTKKVKVNIKRFDPDEFMPLSLIKQKKKIIK